MIAAAATFHEQNVAFGEKESYASLESIGVMAEAIDENGGIVNNKSGTTATKTITTYYKWDIKAQMWVITLSIGEAGRTEVTTYTYPCCVPENGKHCSIGVDC